MRRILGVGQTREVPPAGAFHLLPRIPQLRSESSFLSQPAREGGIRERGPEDSGLFPLLPTGILGDAAGMLGFRAPAMCLSVLKVERLEPETPATHGVSITFYSWQPGLGDTLGTI